MLRLLPGVPGIRGPGAQAGDPRAEARGLEPGPGAGAQAFGPSTPLLLPFWLKPFFVKGLSSYREWIGLRLQCGRRRFELCCCFRVTRFQRLPG